MTIYKHDYKAQKAEELIKDLPGEQGDLIRYYLDKKESEISRLNEKVKEMMGVFNGIARFTNKTNLRF